MMTAANIKYNVDEVNKTVTATVDGCTYDAINLMLKAFRRKNLILTGMDIDKVTTVNPDETHVDENDVNLKVHMYPMITCKEFLLKDTYEGTAIYHPDDNNPFSVERGKEIARRRLYNTYNKDYKKALENVMDAVYAAVDEDMTAALEMTSERMLNFKYYEYYDIFKYNLEESNKL